MLINMYFCFLFCCVSALVALAQKKRYLAKSQQALALQQHHHQQQQQQQRLSPAKAMVITKHQSGISPDDEDSLCGRVNHLSASTSTGLTDTMDMWVAAAAAASSSTNGGRGLEPSSSMSGNSFGRQNTKVLFWVHELVLTNFVHFFSKLFCFVFDAAAN